MPAEIRRAVGTGEHYANTVVVPPSAARVDQGTVPVGLQVVVGVGRRELHSVDDPERLCGRVRNRISGVAAETTDVDRVVRFLGSDGKVVVVGVEPETGGEALKLFLQVMFTVHLMTNTTSVGVVKFGLWG